MTAANESRSGRRGPRSPAGIRLIVAYKLIKSAAQLTATVLLLALATRRHLPQLRAVLDWAAAELPARWSVRGAKMAAVLARPRSVHLAEMGLGLDGMMTFVEGWSLLRGYAWGPWLVVAATGTPIPYELYELARHPRPVRLGVTIANVAIVLYLARRIARQQRERRGAGRVRDPGPEAAREGPPQWP